MKRIFKVMMIVCLVAIAAPRIMAQGWPSAYEGVMLQGFYWDSYSDSKWTNLTAQADELSQYFDLIWVPNSGYCGGGNNMGYMPQYWFKHNSSFGTDAELRTMISTFKAKGTGLIADVVINHRNGVTNWTDFPTETDHKGKTWSWGAWAICQNDEVANASGQAKPTGAYDTGEGFDGCRDLDHTNSTVQEGIKAYLDYLLNDLGYEGFRYDMVKGYSAKYTGIYNEASNVTYSVGEYWDGSYDAVTGWIDGTIRNNKIQSAAFDFPGKYAINEAFANNDMTKLVWARYGTLNQPAGLIHMEGFSRFAVTFIDNHDTYRDGSKFNGNVVAANAFILCSPGTPCVFLPHWKSYKAEIKKLIAARNAVGINNESVVTVLETARDIYAAKVTGSKGTLVVKIGSRSYTPAGYSSSDIVASGTDYCVWTTTEVVDNGGDDVPVIENDGKGISVYLEKNSAWSNVNYYAWNENGTLLGDWPGIAVSNTATVDGTVYYKYTFDSSIKSLNVIFNNGTDQTVDITDVTKDTYYRLNSTSGTTITVTELGANNNGGDDNGGNDDVVQDGPISIYLKKSSVGSWSTVNYYAWDAAGLPLLAAWPGTAVTATETVDDEDFFVYTFPESIQSLNIIFNNGTDQTVDITNVTKTTYYSLDKTSGGDITATVLNINGGDDDGGDNGNDNGGNDNVEKEGPISVYLEKATAWSNVNYYAWTENGTLLGDWPGTAVTATVTDADGNEYYAYTFPEDLKSFNIIFNNGTDQTVDITNVTKTTYYRLDNLTGKYCTATDITNRVHTGVESAVVGRVEVAVYPNPTTDVLYVEAADEVKMVAVYGMSGNLLAQADVAAVDVRHLACGIYLYSVQLADGSVVYGKFVKR